MYRWIACSVMTSLALVGTAVAAQSTPQTQPSVPPAEKVRCKRYTETGSLAKTRKECHTEAEWQQLAIAGRENARDMIRQTGALGSSPK